MISQNMRRALTAAVVAAMLAGCSSTPGSSSSSNGYAPPTKIPLYSPAEMKNVGPHGEPTYPANQILNSLSPDDITKIQAGNYKAAVVWYTAAPFFVAVDSGLNDMFQKLGITKVAETDYEYDAGRMTNQIQSVLALKPDMLFFISADPVAAAAALQPAVDQGVKIFILSNPPAGWVAGKQYVSVVTGDPFEQGKAAADMLAASLSFKGDVGLIYHDAQFYVTNLRDRVMKTTIVRDYPDLHILDEEGFSDPAQAEKLTTAMLTQHPSIKAIYAAWDTVAEGVVAGLRDANRPDVKVVTMDLGQNNVLNMIQRQQVTGITCEITYQLGTVLGTEAGMAMLGKPVPPFANTGYIVATRQNIGWAWQTVFNQALPSNLQSALVQGGSDPWPAKLEGVFGGAGAESGASPAASPTP